MESFKLGIDRLTAERLYHLAGAKKPPLVITEEAKARVLAFRAIIDDKLKSGTTYYGINTGFGFLADVRIDDSKLSELQENLVRSHASGIGDPISIELSRAVMILRLHTFLLGNSGISLSVCALIKAMLDHDIVPVIPERGSVGASGDLAPLAHLALTLIGEGEVFFKSERVSSKLALETAGLKPVQLGPKEGLSITNGTHFMAANAALLLVKSKYLVKSADIIGAMSLDAFKGTASAFDQRIHQLKAHPGQLAVSQNFTAMFALNDDIMISHKDCRKVQDPYSFRCIPQVHGASRDALDFVESVVEREINSVTDNPLVFDDGAILSGGNFHGQAVAMAMDFLGIAVAEIASIAEQRIMKLTNPQMSGLPAFLIEDSGLNSGFMIPHVAAASLVSENKVLAHPACVDSIPTSADKEDHVSMGPIAAKKAWQIVFNCSRVLSIELIAACQGIDLHKGLKPNKVLEAVYLETRKVCAYMKRDRSISKEIDQIGEWILSGEVCHTVAKTGFKLN